VPNRIIGLLGYPAGRINLDSVVIREHALGITLEERYDPRELFRHRLVIGVQKARYSPQATKMATLRARASPGVGS
jgi:hypothetical protein